MGTMLRGEDILDLVGGSIPNLLEAYEQQRLGPEDVILSLIHISEPTRLV